MELYLDTDSYHGNIQHIQMNDQKKSPEEQKCILCDPNPACNSKNPALFLFIHSFILVCFPYPACTSVARQI